MKPFYLLTALVVIASACSDIKQEPEPTRAAMATEQDYFGDSASRIIYPEQNWSAADSEWFYTAPQGSNLIPYDIFIQLEQADSQQLFRAEANMRRYRYLPQHPSATNPQGLPVGWVKEHHQGKDYIGLTCAACHTSQLNYKGVGIRIDGGAAMADMDTMLQELEQALGATWQQPDKLTRLATALNTGGGPQARAQLRQQVRELQLEIAQYNRSNRSLNGATSIPYGFARLDAFGRIYNRILGHLTPGQDNHNPPNAPVSYPFLWDTPQHDFVQWNGVGNNAGLGPLARNTGEVLGVFASFSLQPDPSQPGFASSAKIPELEALEARLSKLWSPQWSELAERGVLPPIDLELAEQGRSLYFQYQCHRCHEAIDRTDPNRRVIAQMASVERLGTDPAAARNALIYGGQSGYFKGLPQSVTQPNGPRFGDTTAALPALSAASAGVIQRALAQSNAAKPAGASSEAAAATRKHLDFDQVDELSPAALMAYKGRPLNGIWATAPFMHNGSVSSLYQLFLPSCQQSGDAQLCRHPRFSVGQLAFDPIEVGFSQPAAPADSELFIFDASLPGNSNQGHEYAAGVTPVPQFDPAGKPLRDGQGHLIEKRLSPLDHSQRLALVEYLKTL
ncbi:di-heme-cytochrome C peroxidase [Gilvimarinus agarilyticus]|uniref:di-heme-cytochrome C peroxidase n=1 Tax=Gilvimarinus agarilyticus TaxID=679259 RepID=UPI00059FAD5B|nr:di-heme-cytochrome C peroxidase [Gilvimarinus agarilyticus]